MDINIYNNGNLITIDKVIFDPNAAIDMLNNPYNGQILLHQLYEKYGVNSMPKRFELIITFFSDRSQTSNFKDYLNQWKLVVYSPSLGDVKHHCCCSHEIMRLFYFLNTINHSILLIGSDCINKFASGTNMHRDYKIMKRLVRQCKNCHTNVMVDTIIGGYCPNCQEHNDTNKRYCVTCLKLKVADATEKRRCKQCYREGRTNYINILRTQVCHGCQSEFSIKNNEKWKTHCGSCINKSKIACKTCGDPFFARAQWMKECLQCYKRKKLAY